MTPSWPAQTQAFQEAAQARPGDVAVHLQWARRLREGALYSQAVEVLRGVLRTHPRQADVLLELGNLFMLQGREPLAQHCYKQLLRHASPESPLYPLALFNLAQAQHLQDQPQAALQTCQAALAQSPGDVRMLCFQAMLRLSLCDWHQHDAGMAQLQTGLNHYLQQRDDPAPSLPPQPALTPLPLLSFPMPLSLQTNFARYWAEDIGHSMQPFATALPRRPPSNGVIRVGYLSADFRQHAMGALVHGLFAHHQRPQFEVFAYSLVDVADEYTASVQRGADHFCVVHADSPQAIAQRIRSDGIDVLIDLMGYTRLSRPEVLALRAAPIQLHYLGYPGPLAADFYDGVIADEALIPAHLQAGYREKVHRLPCAFVWSPPPVALPVPAQPPTRADHGLPEDAVVYASFNRAHKLDPHTFDLWLDVLAQVHGSVLWLIQDLPLVQERLRACASAKGVQAGRLVFSAPVPAADFASLCALADLMLDTAHYGAGATGVAALRAGLPLLTCPGDGFASRMGASLCIATGLHALICESPDAYRARAVALGRAPTELAQYRRKLLEQRDQLPLFQTAAWVRSLENVIRSCFEAALAHNPYAEPPTRPTNPILPTTSAKPNTMPAQSSPDFAHWLRDHDVSLAFSTYRANRLIFVGRNAQDQLKIHERLFDRPMGLFVTNPDPEQDGDQGGVHSLWMAGRSQLWRLDNLLAPGQTHEGADRLYVPAACFTTGEVNAHEIVITPDAHGAAQPLFVNTAFSCLARVQPGCSFAPTWQPPFISQLTPDDRCHLNGLALVDGVPTWATACGSSDSPAGWRDHRAGGGVVLHIPSHRIAARGLSMPHSPRWHMQKLWLLNSGTGELGWIENERFVPLCFVPGFARGLAFVGGYAVVGLSKLRSPQFTGLPLEEQLNGIGLPGGCCGLRVIDLASGAVVHSLDLPDPIDELFDVVVLPGTRQPRALGLQGEDIHCLVKLPGRDQLTTIRPKAPSGNPHQAKPPPVFGLPTAAKPSTAAPVRYQRVFQLTPDTLAPYASLTSPSLAPGSQALQHISGELLAVSAMQEGTMVGLAVAERHADGSASMISLMVQPHLCRQGIGTRMVAHLQGFLAEVGVRELAVLYPASVELATCFEPLLKRLHWAPPGRDSQAAPPAKTPIGGGLLHSVVQLGTHPVAMAGTTGTTDATGMQTAAPPNAPAGGLG